MKADVKYIFECQDGFRFVRDTFEEIERVFDENVKALVDVAGEGDRISVTKDFGNHLSPKAHISAQIDGTWKFYDLYSEVTPIQ
ncbi:MAG: hypothetical protein IJ190_14390 [Prevotella sp.]|nr:hypothetical protein [Prevotella sp.]